MMLRAQLFENFANALKAFASVAAEGGCLHCIAFDKAVREATIEGFNQAVSLVETTKKLPEVWGENDDPGWIHYGQIFIDTPDGRIRFVSSLGTEVVLAPAEDDEFRVTVVGKPESVHRRIKAARGRWHLDSVEHYEVRDTDQRLRDARQEFCKEFRRRKAKGWTPELGEIGSSWDHDDLMLVLLGAGDAGNQTASGADPLFLLWRDNDELKRQLFAAAREFFAGKYFTNGEWHPFVEGTR